MCLTLICWVALSGFVIANPQQAVVVDEAGVLSPEVRQSVERINAELAPSGAQVAVAVIPSLQGEPIETVANETFRAWGIGDRSRSNGVLFLVAVEDRQYRLEIGYGLEGAIPDGVAGRIQRDLALPALKAGDYDGAVSEVVRAVTERIVSEYGLERPSLEGLAPQSDPVRPVQRRYNPLRSLLGLVFWGAIALGITGRLLGWHRSARGRTRRTSQGVSADRGFREGVYWYTLLNLLEALNGGNGRGGRGGFGGGGFGGGFGGGGFGGGSSGGGGASGSW